MLSFSTFLLLLDDAGSLSSAGVVDHTLSALELLSGHVVGEAGFVAVVVLGLGLLEAHGHRVVSLLLLPDSRAELSTLCKLGDEGVHLLRNFLGLRDFDGRGVLELLLAPEESVRHRVSILLVDGLRGEVQVAPRRADADVVHLHLLVCSLDVGPDVF